MLTQSESIIVIGTGGFATEVKWLVDDINAAGTNSISIESFVHAGPVTKNVEFEGGPVRTEADYLLTRQIGKKFVVAIGDNAARKKVAEKFIQIGYQPLTIVHPSVARGQGIKIGDGSIIMANAILAPYCYVGDFAIINTAATVGHHCKLNDFVNVCPGARISGACEVEEGAVIGSNAVLHPRAKVGSWASVGPASYLLKSAQPGSSWIGVPAKRFL